MSSFNGCISEFSDVFIDNFSFSFLRVNRHQTFFLSHAHSDHMRGLDSKGFYTKLTSNTHSLIFSTEETKAILANQRKYERISKRINARRVFEPFRVKTGLVADKNGDEHGSNCSGGRAEKGSNCVNSIEVTFLPAQHCPGSVSIYLRGVNDDTRVLYTGDFRWEEAPMRDLMFLRRYHPEKTVLDNVYLDTTFCLARMTSFPSREEVAIGVVQIARHRDNCFS